MSISDVARRVSDKNLNDIKAFFEKNPYSSQTDCANYLGLNKVTVWRHLKTLKKELREKSD